MVPIRQRRRLMAITALAGLAVLLTPVAPASALSVTTPPSSPAPLLPLPLPIAGSVSGGTGGDPIDVTVTGPGSTGIEATLPGLPSAPALPVGPTASLPDPIASGDPVATAVPALPTPGGTEAPAGAAPGEPAVTLRPSAPVRAHPSAEGARPPAPPADARPANLSAAIDAQPADSLLRRVPAIATRIALWAALAGIVFGLQMLVGSTVRQRRNRTAHTS